MKKALLNTIAIATLTVGMLMAPAVTMAQEVTYDDRIAMSYLDEGNTDQGQFEQFNLHGDYDDAHELNDAWLGMPVRDAQGEVIGFVEDAFLDNEGYLTELLVSLNGSGVAVYVDQSHVEYTEVSVLIDLPVKAIASLEQE